MPALVVSPVVMTATVALCGILYYRFKRSGWL
jgi:hypothetical protein